MTIKSLKFFLLDPIRFIRVYRYRRRMLRNLDKSANALKKIMDAMDRGEDGKKEAIEALRVLDSAKQLKF